MLCCALSIACPALGVEEESQCVATVVCFCWPSAPWPQPRLLAQVVITSTIVGTVTDPQGAVVSEAKVTLTNVDTGVQWKATTNANGDYQFANLIAGHYKVEVSEEGFAHTDFDCGDASKTARLSALTSDSRWDRPPRRWKSPAPRR